MIVARWREGIGESLYGDVDANKAAQEIRTLGNGFSPADVVNVARDERSELHKCFEWEDSKAAELWRLKQARSVISCLVIEEKETPKERPQIRVFYRTEAKSEDGDENVSGYMETRIIVKNEDAYANLLAQARRELRSFKAKYSCLVELRDIMDLID